ncbi:MAG: HNH endonuclease [Candidatus Bathyarchaeota archaeon]|nr:MAG: HNH endonuclease [Candidatus Bathyarchaeota archaeon]
MGAWEAHHKTSQAAGGEEILSNCEILCLQCYQETRTNHANRKC